VNASIDEDGIEIVDENLALEKLLEDASKTNENPDEENEDSDEEDDIDLSDLLDMDGLEPQ
jgi:hypothetical protein